jgi:hypothetical protein
MSMLSIRDVFRVMWLPYERLDNRNLVFEHSRHMVRQKFHQTINVMFDVHGSAGSDIAGRLKLANDAVRDAERAAQALRAMVEEEHPLGALVLETNRDNARRDVAALAAQLAVVDSDNLSRERGSPGFGERSVRPRMPPARRRSACGAGRAWSIVWARCGGQYADDKKKPTFLKEAEQLFDPLHVTVCPACLSTLDFPPVLVDGACTLCGHEVEPEGDSVAEQQEDARRQRGKRRPA